MTATTLPTLCIDNTLAHRWQLEPPNGTLIPGTCAYCHTTRTFAPFYDEDLKGREASIRANHYAGQAHPPKNISVSGRRSGSTGKKFNY